MPLADQGAIEGCSWSASSPSVGSGFVFLGEVDDSRSLMNIDGSDTELTLVYEHGSFARVGDVLERKFEGGGSVVIARYRVTYVCPEAETSCEVTRFAADFEVLKGSERETLSATGDVGC